MTDRLLRAFDRANAAAQERQFIRGRLGRKNDDGSYSMTVPDKANFVYVTLTGEGNQTVSIALNPFVNRIVNLPVKMRRVNGVLVIKEIDDAPGALPAFLNGGNAGTVGPHSHKTGSGLEYEMESEWFRPGRVVWSGTGVTVRARPLHYGYMGSRYYAGGTLDLTAYLPATTDKWAWILVGLDPATNALAAVTGAEYDAQVDLTADKIANIDPGNLIPLGAVQAQEGDTSLSAISRYADARRWVDGERVFRQTVVDADLPVTIIPIGANDANYGVLADWFVIADETVGTGGEYIAPDDSAALSPIGDTLTLAVSAAGVVTLDGTLTQAHEVAIWLRYIP